MKILIIGCGSIGERHIKNLKKISKRNELFVFDKDWERLKLVKKKYQVKIVTNLAGILLKEQFSCALICTTPNTHVKLAQKLADYNIPLFIEKPLSHNFLGLNRLRQTIKNKTLPVLIGYNLHFHPGLILIKQLLAEKKIGRLLSIRIEAGQYLPDWRPWQDYRQSYTSRSALGGGIILDGSHEIDYLCWLLSKNKPVEILCWAEKISDLEVDTEDTAEILLKFDNAIIANIHLDFTQRVYSRSCKLIGTTGTIFWDYPAKQVRLYTAKQKKWLVFKFKFQPNDMYLAEMKHFLKVAAGQEKPLVTLKAAENTLKIALSAKKSALINKKISL